MSILLTKRGGGKPFTFYLSARHECVLRVWYTDDTFLDFKGDNYLKKDGNISKDATKQERSFIDSLFNDESVIKCVVNLKDAVTIETHSVGKHWDKYDIDMKNTIEKLSPKPKAMHINNRALRLLDKELRVFNKVSWKRL